MLNKTVYIELDNVLCDYNRRALELRRELDLDEGDNLPVRYKDIEPIDTAIEAFEQLANLFEVYIITPDVQCEEKIEWVRTHLPFAVEWIVFCDTEEIREGNYLICRDHKKAGCFRGRVIEFLSMDFPGWEDVAQYIAAKEEGDTNTCLIYEYEDDETLARNFVTRWLVEKTIAQLDAFMKELNEKYEQQGGDDLYKRIVDIAKITNKWLEVAGEKDENKYYDI